jgi:ABC-2 type transport system permease protein
MNTSSNMMHESAADSREIAAVFPPRRPFAWCVQRELWENRSLYLAPISVAGLVLVGFALSSTAGIWEPALRVDAVQPANKLTDPYEFAAFFIMGAAFLVSFFYSVDCLYGERRDRSILFWKSLPVSDLTTVLAKAAIPMALLPLLSYAITAVVQCFMLLYSSLVVAASGQSVAMLWSKVHLYQLSSGLLYHLITVHMLWYAPIYAWLLLISAWARRAPFLWAFLPPAGIGIFEHFAFHTTHFAHFIGWRLSGPETSSARHESMEHLFPMNGAAFFATPGLWLGLVFTAICLAAAVRLRRYREPN